MLWEIKNLNGNIIGIFGHGGMGISSALPLNSLASLQEALDCGADGVEMDVQMSRDSVLFVFHNIQLEEASTCNGKIHEMLASEIECHFKEAFRSHKVLRLVEMLDALDLKDKQHLIFECKIPDFPSNAFLQAFSGRLIELLAAHGLHQNSIIEATHSDFLEMIRQRNSDFPRLFIYTNDFAHGIETAGRLKLFGITMDQQLITPHQIEVAHEKGFRITLFNQKTEEDNLEAIGMNPDYVQTDKLKHLVKIFKD